MKEQAKIPVETERKFLIAMPDTALLEKMPDKIIKKIEQTYLLSSTSGNSRVRKIEIDGKISYVKTVKKRISELSQLENEFEITSSEYEKELLSRDPEKNTIFKTRYCIPLSDGHTAEIDIYPFWQDRAILEIELSCEDEKFAIPDFVKLIKEVSFDKRYKNTNLGKEIPFDCI